MGLPYTALMIGAKLAMPGQHLDPQSLLDLYASESVTMTAGVPTIAFGIQQALEREPQRWHLSPNLRSGGRRFSGAGSTDPSARPVRRARDTGLGHDGNLARRPR